MPMSLYVCRPIIKRVWIGYMYVYIFSDLNSRNFSIFVLKIHYFIVIRVQLDNIIFNIPAFRYCDIFKVNFDYNAKSVVCSFGIVKFSQRFFIITVVKCFFTSNEITTF